MLNSEGLEHQDLKAWELELCHCEMLMSFPVLVP